MVKKIILILGSALIALSIIYALGPKPNKPIFKKEIPQVPQTPKELETYITQIETFNQPIKPENEARIIWANDSTKQKTDFALVYLHGFSASQEEGNPIHRWLASTYGMNLYLARLADHGRSSSEALLHFNADSAWSDAQKALAIGKAIGEKVILLSTSTGGTLSLMLAAWDTSIYAQILLSPNIAINDQNAWLLNNPWGLQIAQQVLGSSYKIVEDTTAIYAKYWDRKYRVEALVQLEELIETAMVPATFKAIHQPTLLLYYFKDNEHQDPVVRVDAMLEMFRLLGTPENKKHQVALPNTGVHVIGSQIKSKDLTSVQREIDEFMKKTLAIKPFNLN